MIGQPTAKGEVSQQTNKNLQRMRDYYQKQIHVAQFLKWDAQFIRNLHLN